MSEQKVMKLIIKLSNSRSLALDELDNYSVKVAAEVIARPLHYIITLSIMQAQFPSSWKFAKVLSRRTANKQVTARILRKKLEISEITTSQ